MCHQDLENLFQTLWRWPGDAHVTVLLEQGKGQREEHYSSESCTEKQHKGVKIVRGGQVCTLKDSG